MATMYQRIQEFARTNQNRPVGPGEIDPVTGLPVTARTPSGPTGFVGGQIAPQAATRAGETPVVNQAFQRNTAQQAQDQIAQELQQQESRRTRGRASTLFTGSGGLLSSPSVSRRSLMGF